jgi:hypothetical protein
MDTIQIPFEYIIKNGELFNEKRTVIINEEEVRILGVKTETLFKNDNRRFLPVRTALFITFRGNQYGNTELSLSEFLSQLKTCCIPGIDPILLRLHSIEHAIEFE